MVKRNGRKNSKLILNLNSSAPALSTLFQCYDDESVCCLYFVVVVFSIFFVQFFRLSSMLFDRAGRMGRVDCHSHNKGWDDVEIATVTFFIK